MTIEPTTIDFHAIARSNEIPEGALLGATLGDQQLVLGRFEGQLYALDGACSHQGAPLCDGDLDGPVLSAPCTTAPSTSAPAAPERLPIDTPIARYAVREYTARFDGVDRACAGGAGARARRALATSTRPCARPWTESIRRARIVHEAQRREDRRHRGGPRRHRNRAMGAGGPGRAVCAQAAWPSTRPAWS